MEIVPITKDNLEKFSEAAAKFGMPRSEGWLRRTMFDPTVEDLAGADSCRGHMSVVDGGEVVAVQGYYYQPCYFKQRKILGGTGCVMGANHRYGEELLRVLDRNAETRIKCQLGFGNVLANKRSAKVAKVTGRMVEPPYRPYDVRVAVADCSAYPLTVLDRLRVPIGVRNVIWMMLRPLSWVLKLVRAVTARRSAFEIISIREFSTAQWEDFWQRFLAANTGVISSREPLRMSWLFEASIRAGKVYAMAAVRNGRVEGYAMIREMVGKGWAKTFEVIDICAVNNDCDCLRALAKAAVCEAGRHRGVKVMFFGHMPKQEMWLDGVFRIRRQADHAFVLCSSRDAEIKESLLRNEGWFWGPFDGERCMGHGGAIDL